MPLHFPAQGDSSKCQESCSMWLLESHQDASINRPHLFCGLSYQLWKVRIKFFVESIDRKIWNVITNSYLMPISENVSSEREHLDCVAMNIIVSALDSNELLKVS